MARQSRVMCWPDFRQELEQQRGTVIVERYSFSGPTRWWWTQENVSEICPYPIVDWFKMSQHARYRPLVGWFRQRYTDPDSGGALLIAIDGVPKSEVRSVASKMEGEFQSARRIEVAPPESLSKLRRAPGKILKGS